MREELQTSVYMVDVKIVTNEITATFSEKEYTSHKNKSTKSYGVFT